MEVVFDGGVLRGQAEESQPIGCSTFPRAKWRAMTSRRERLSVPYVEVT